MKEEKEKAEKQREEYDKASLLLDRSFNSLSFELLKKAVGEGAEIDLIQNPSDERILKEYKEDVLSDNDEKMSDEELLEACFERYQESEHYPMWSTIFEAKDNFLSEKIMNDIDGLYDLGIGVIGPTDDTLACLFIAGAGYDFYNAHWIPLFKHWDWIKEEI